MVGGWMVCLRKAEVALAGKLEVGQEQSLPAALCLSSSGCPNIH